jgi:hypothetical protein
MNPRRFDMALYASCAVLMGAFTYEVWAPLGEFTLPAAVLPERPPLPTVTPFNPPPQSSFAAIDARPIFSPARKPIESTAVAGTGIAAAPPDVMLIGVILDGKTQLALLKREGAPFAESTAVGGSVDGWEVTEITPDHVVLRSGAQDFVLSMDGKRKSVPSSPNALQPGVQPGPAVPAPLGRQPAKPRAPTVSNDQDSGASDQQHSETVGAQ